MRRIFGAVLVLLCAGAAFLADAPLSRGKTSAAPEPSPTQTIGYLIQNFKVAGLHPELAITLEYNAPTLRITWQRQSVVPDTHIVQIQNQQAVIDLRYAHFDAWNDGRRDRNVILVECANYFPCFRDESSAQGLGHGEVDYLVRGYAAESLAAALNHLASFNASLRPKEEF